jgi:endo-alpha-N-acetylgalactosaminidase
MRRTAVTAARFLALSVVASSAVAAVVVGGVTSPAHAGTPVTIASTDLRVSVDSAFPRVISYTDVASGATMYGDEDTLSQVVINGTVYTPTVTATTAADHVDYVLTFGSYGNVEIDVTLKVVGHELDLNVIKIADTTTNKVNSLAFATTGTGDTFTTLTGTTATDASPVSSMYAIVNTSQLAASISTNSYYDSPSGATAQENGRIKRQVVDKGTYRRLGIWSGDWTYHASGAAYADTEPLPWAKVVIAGDRNADNTVDWQDGAIAFRDIMTNPHGWQQVAQRPVMRIPFNFASQATHPFLETLDETKRVALNTDGLGQFVLLKGYGSEGHDSAHPDYALVGKRQGGPAELNKLIASAHGYNADIGIHIQDTEWYPVAKNFDPAALLNDPVNDLGWDWLDQSYHINYRKDGESGARLARLQALRAAVPALDFLYIDTWYGDGYTTEKFAREMNGLGFDIATEFPDKFENSLIWSHWANDVNYGGTTYKGINSQIVRFIRNHQRDDWIAGDPLLGGGELAAYEGWQGKNDYNAFINKTFSIDLPTKYLQGSPITRWTTAGITEANGVTVTKPGTTRQISKDGHLILNGSSYLLPWDQAAEAKLYHWNAAGGSTTWTLPTSWGTPSSVKLYKLTDTGRQLVSDLAVSNRQITINATANTPYVVYKTDPGANPAPGWGEGTPLTDPNFFSGSLTPWTVTGDTGKASIATTTVGQKQLQIAGGTGTTVSQTMTGLTPGTYSASVYVATSAGRKATLTVAPTGGTSVSNWADDSLVTNSIGGDEYNGSKLQRMRVLFDVPSGQSSATLSLSAANGTPTVSFDTIRVVPTTRTPQGTHYFVEDFENVDAGWFPFVAGGAGGTKSDPRTHIAQLNAPYTQAGWNGHLTDDVLAGQESLKSHEERQGLIYRTLPQTLRFAAGRSYQVTFRYEATNSGEYQFVTGTGTTTQSTTDLAGARTPTTFTATVTGASGGDTWIGIVKTATGADTGNQQHDLMVDNLVVDDVTGTTQPARVPQSQMSVKYVDSEDTATSGQASNVLDGDPATLWHTAWSQVDPDPAPPHEIQLDLGSTYSVSCLYYLPRQSGANGRIANFEVYTSTDGSTWGTAAKTGIWTNTSAEESACFTARNARYVRLRALSEVNGNAWTSAAELNVAGAPPAALPRLAQSSMTVKYVDSAETVAENTPGTNVLDGDSSTFWGTQWYQTTAPMPHEIQLDLGSSKTVDCLYYTPRQSQSNGRIAGYEVYTSTDGTTWGSAVKTGTFANSTLEQSACWTAKTARYVRLKALSEVNANPWTTVAELNVGGQ